MIWAFVALAAVMMAPFFLLTIRLMNQNKELSKLLASRNITEYSLAEARVAKANIEQKPDADPGYGDAWEREEK